MKLDDVQDIFEWLEQKCKDQKKLVDELADLCRMPCGFYRCGEELISAQKGLHAYIEHKIGVEKYMMQLRCQGK